MNTILSIFPSTQPDGDSSNSFFFLIVHPLIDMKLVICYFKYENNSMRNLFNYLCAKFITTYVRTMNNESVCNKCEGNYKNVQNKKCGLSKRA